MVKLYKLTDTNNFTRPGAMNGCKWGEGISHSGTGEGELCGPGYIHAYLDPFLAVFLNPIHANYKPFNLWEAEGDIIKTKGQLKVGCLSLTAIKQIPVPEITQNQKNAFGILVTKEVFKDRSWNEWADKWLSEEDRSSAAAHAAYAASYASYASFAAAARAAAYATYADADAAVAASAAAAVYASTASVYASTAAVYASTTDAALDLISIAKIAVTDY